VINTSAITAATKSSMKPEAVLLKIITYAVVEKGVESKGEQRLALA